MLACDDDDAVYGLPEGHPAMPLLSLMTKGMHLMQFTLLMVALLIDLPLFLKVVIRWRILMLDLSHM